MIKFIYYVFYKKRFVNGKTNLKLKVLYSKGDVRWDWLFL